MANLKDFDHLSKEHDYIEVTQWNNEEGWDIFINERHISLTYGQLEAINYLTKHLELSK
jgi:hypothetical protein